jgi:2-haloalkanoic acid dehalogenase type II
MLNRGDSLVNFGSYEVVSFDCYGTLIDWEDGIVSGLRPLLTHHGVEATDNEILNLHAQTEHRLQSTSTRGNYTKYRDVLREEVREAGRRWGFEPEPSEIDALPDSLRYWQPFPDTVEALKAMKNKYKLAIISNVDDGLFALTACHLEVEFDWIVTAEQAGPTNPHRTSSSWPWSKSGWHRRGSCTPPRISSTTTSPRRSWVCPPCGCTDGRIREGSERPHKRAPNPPLRSRT